MDQAEEPTSTATGMAAEPRVARGLLAAAASLVLPGAGQLAVGARRRGLVMLAITASLVVVVQGRTRPAEVSLDALTRPP